MIVPPNIAIAALNIEILLLYFACWQLKVRLKRLEVMFQDQAFKDYKHWLETLKGENKEKTN